jgi:hypothetical protein
MVFNVSDIKIKAEPRQPMVLIYAKNGAGKTTFLATMGNPFVIDSEDKCNDLNVSRYTPKSSDDLIDCLNYLLNLDAFPTSVLVVDTIDWIAKLIEETICREYSVKTIIDDRTKDLNYGKGNILLANRFLSDLVPLFQKIRVKHNIPVVFFAQAGDSKPKDADSESISKTVDIRMNEHFAKMLCDVVDAKMYIKRKRFINQKGEKVPVKDRYLVCDETTKIEAKNNLYLSDEIFIGEHTGWYDFLNDVEAGKKRRFEADLARKSAFESHNQKSDNQPAN